MFCARDHFGMRPFYYHHAANKRFLFASDPRSILVLPQVPYAINQGRVADFLVPELEWIDYTSTFFEEVYRLPPGHRATVTPGKLEIEEYWRPQPGLDPARRSMHVSAHRQARSPRC
jgi:asparagine synthase (glutamine-hydrolysing)